MTARQRSKVCAPVHEDFGFDDGNQSGFLAQRGVTGQRMCVGLDATPGRNVLTDGNHRTPFGKTRTHLEILLEPVAQPVQTFRDFLAGMSGQILGSSIDFDARNDACVGEDFEERRAVFLLLTDRFVIEDYPTDALAEIGRGDNQFPIRAPGLDRLRNAELRESFVAGGIAFIHRQQTFVVGKQLFCGID